MKGIEFYKSLQKKYTKDGRLFYKNYSFKCWLEKSNGTESLQFNLKNSSKAIPKEWIIDAKNAENKKIIIDRDWFNQTYKQKNFNDCRASVLIWLLKNHKP